MFIIKDILKKLRETSSSKEKLKILTENKENKDLEKIFKYAYDKVDYVFNVSRKSVENYGTEMLTDLNLDEVLKNLNERTVTGYKALELAKAYINENPENSELFLEILDRDLKVGVNSKTLNKVWKGIIPKPKYCRCDILSKKNLKKIHFPAYVQLKCDGTYRECSVHDGKVSFKTRSGEDYSNPVLEESLKVLPDGFYVGEFTLGEADNPDSNRAEGNGLINSDNPPYDKINFTVWDFLTDDEYLGLTKTSYEIRFENLKFILENIKIPLVKAVPCEKVNSISEALEITSKWMEKGLEGSVLKDLNMYFKDGTSKEQLKIKLKVDADLRCKGFLEGTKGSKYEGKNKVILFESDDGKVKGQCSGMTDDMVDEVTKNPEKYIGKILSVEFNDLTKAQSNDYFALSHPVFICFRDDKNEADTFERICELRDMAKNLEGY